MVRSRSTSRSTSRPRSSRGRKWKSSIIKHYGAGYYNKLERCVKSVKSRNKKYFGYSKYNPWAVCQASIRRTKKSHKRASNSRSKSHKR